MTPRNILLILIIILLCRTAYVHFPTEEVVVVDVSSSSTPVPTPVPTPAPTPEPFIVTEYDGFDPESERILWELCCKYAPSEYAAAGAMGMFYRESRYKSNALCGWASARPEFPTMCEDFVAVVDEGLEDGSSYDYFFENVHNKYGGFGLVTWYSEVYLRRLYAFAQGWGTSIADAEMQVAFLFFDVERNDPELWETLTTSTSAQVCGEQFGIRHDRTYFWDSIGGFADQIYRRHHEQ